MRLGLGPGWWYKVGEGHGPGERMPSCMFASDLHGSVERYEKLLAVIAAETPEGVFLGGDLLPSPYARSGPDGHGDFVDYLAHELGELRARLGAKYPAVFAILGNDDGRAVEPAVKAVADQGLWSYVHGRYVAWQGYDVYGYAYVPPTPFALKDWERYDVSRFVDPGCVSPEEGRRTVAVSADEARYATIQGDLEQLTEGRDLSRAVFLFHSPPYQTPLDRAALDGMKVDHVPVDVHVGSIAIRRFIEASQPRITLHGHVHEAVRLTGQWHTQLGGTHLYGGAHDGPELALVRFDPEHPDQARRSLL